MTKFNQSSQGSRKTFIKEGGTAYEIDDKSKLVTMVLTSFFNEPNFYGDTSRELVETAKTIMNTDPKFVANLAIYTREVFYMRSISQVLAVELANHSEGSEFARKTIARISKHPDDMTEMVWYQLAVYGGNKTISSYGDKPPKVKNKPIPNSMKKGLEDAFSSFNEYQLAKYNRTGKDVTLKDVFRLVNPSVTEGTERYELYQRLLKDTLEAPYTWKTKLSEKGNKKEAWEELIESGRIDYTALLHNLPNIINSGASNIDTVYNTLRDPEQVKKSKQLPFHFFSAYQVAQRELPHAGNKVLDVLNDAIETSVENIPKLHGTTFMAADMSQSMTWYYVSKDSTIHCGHVAAMIMSMAHSFCDNPITSVFATTFKQMNVSTRSGILDNMNTFLNAHNELGGGTNLHLSLQHLLDNKIKVDRILFFSDKQVYSEPSSQKLISQYRKKVNPDVWVHSFNLKSTSKQHFIGDKTNLIGGWSEKSLDFIRYAEEGTDSLISAIENYQ